MGLFWDGTSQAPSFQAIRVREANSKPFSSRMPMAAIPLYAHWYISNENIPFDGVNAMSVVDYLRDFRIWCMIVPMPKVQLWGYLCERCGHEWLPRQEEEPRVCPKCKSPYWNKPRRTGSEATSVGQSNGVPSKTKKERRARPRKGLPDPEGGESQQ